MPRTTAFIPKPSLPPPSGTVGVLGWLRGNLLYSWSSAFLSALCVGLIGWLVWYVLDWSIFNAVWEAGSRRECLDRSPDGACWAGVVQWSGALLYGRYPPAERWRVDLAFVWVVLWILPLWLPGVRSKPVVAISALLLSPFVAGYFFAGGVRGWIMQAGVAMALAVFLLVWLHVLLCVTTERGLGQWLAQGLGREESMHKLPMMLVSGVLSVGLGASVWGWELAPVNTNLWGGLFLTFIIAGVGMVASLPGGVLLALGRRSRLMFIRAVVIVYVELVRSVPLITVLFMAVTMMPLFLPVERNPDKLTLVLAAVVLFSSAYMAEVVRGGLQAIPLGQVEAARSIGLSRWHVMRLVVLPQALRHMIPNIAGSFIGLLKDTTVVAIVGLYDFTRMLQVPSQTPTWIGLHIELFFLGGMVYLLLCLGISRYSHRLERKLAVD